MNEQVDWIKSWNDVADTMLSAVLFYALIVVAVRLFGKRSTAQLNNFDWIINVTVGSLAASGILLDSVPASRATAAILVLMVLQFVMTWLVLRFPAASKIVKASPTLLMHKGEFIEDAMKHTRITHEEICSALRAHGIADLDGASWVILETDGRLTVIPRNDTAIDDASAMENVNKPHRLPPL